MSGKVDDLELPVAEIDHVFLGDEPSRRRAPQAIAPGVISLVREGVDQQFVEGRIAGVHEQLAQSRRDIGADQSHDSGRVFHRTRFGRMHPAVFERMHVRFPNASHPMLHVEAPIPSFGDGIAN